MCQLTVINDDTLCNSFVLYSLGSHLEPETLPNPLKTDGNDSYKCPICGFTSIYCGSVKRHIASHSSKRRFHCYLCPKAFKRKDYLTQHMYLHFPEKVKASSSKT